MTITAPRGGLETYSRRARAMRFVRCATCDCVVYEQRRGKGRDGNVGLNARLFDHAVMANVPVKVLDGDQTWRSLGTYVKPELWISPARRR